MVLGSPIIASITVVYDLKLFSQLDWFVSQASYGWLQLSKTKKFDYGIEKKANFKPCRAIHKNGLEVLNGAVRKSQQVQWINFERRMRTQNVIIGRTVVQEAIQRNWPVIVDT